MLDLKIHVLLLGKWWYCPGWLRILAYRIWYLRQFKEIFKIHNNFQTSGNQGKIKNNFSYDLFGHITQNKLFLSPICSNSLCDYIRAYINMRNVCSCDCTTVSFSFWIVPFEESSFNNESLWFMQRCLQSLSWCFRLQCSLGQRQHLSMFHRLSKMWIYWWVPFFDTTRS